MKPCGFQISDPITVRAFNIIRKAAPLVMSDWIDECFWQNSIVVATRRKDMTIRFQIRACLPHEGHLL